jgi:methionyl-tRNA synthetase
LYLIELSTIRRNRLNRDPVSVFCDKIKPWEEKESSREVVGDLLLAIGEIGQLLAPFLPETSEKIQRQILKNKKEILFPRFG